MKGQICCYNKENFSNSQNNINVEIKVDLKKNVYQTIGMDKTIKTTHFNVIVQNQYLINWQGWLQV